jgi:lipid-A-disaccharide synthase
MPDPRAPRIALIAGEASGDQLGAGLVAAIRERCPDASFAGIAGPRMQASGVQAWWEADALAVMGLVEVMRHLPRLLRLRRDLLARLRAWQPDVVVGIDAPDFNLGVERRLKRQGLRVLHYVSPSVWAWRAGRARKIAASCDEVLCLFPMEPPIYHAHGVAARFVGHPLADALPLQPDHAGARARLHLATGDRALAVLPGSRLGEIRRLLPVFLDAFAELRRTHPDLLALLPAANTACRQVIDVIVAAHPAAAAVRVLDGQAEAAMLASDAVLLASGTVALEAMLCQRPMVVGYRISPTTHRIVRGLGLIKTRFVALPNVLAGEALVPEHLQDECTPERLAASLARWLDDPAAVAALMPRFLGLHAALRRDASAQAAEAVCSHLRGVPRA